MITEEIVSQIRETFAMEPTGDQARAMQVFAEFLVDRDAQAAMILRGSAGTGKTTLASAMVRLLLRLGRKVVLMAPTGRAAKVFSLNSGQAAMTIHKRIYRQKSITGFDTPFALADNLSKDTVFMVDEASMIANEGFGESVFGTGRILDDLVKYVYNDQNCRLLVIGDRAQLPPVGETESPALSKGVLECYGLQVHECDLDEVLRQSRQSGILYNATIIRQFITGDPLTHLPRIRFHGFADIQPVSGNELIDILSESYRQAGIDETIVITRSNKCANIYNQGIRNKVLDMEDELCRGDMLMVVKNNYFWTEREGVKARAAASSAGAEAEAAIPSFIANGDRAMVLRMTHERELYGFRFADVLLRFPDYDDFEMKSTVCLDALHSEAPALTREQGETLFNRVLEDYEYLQKSERIKKLKQDGHYNAFQVKYAYAVTCHKAQGGQWANVFIDQGYMTEEMLDNDYVHWLYTAFTRATEKLYLVNWQEQQMEKVEG